MLPSISPPARTHTGTAGVCNGFLSGFWWLDQLAATASKGHSAMCRQCLVGGNYSLIEQRTDADGTTIAAWTPNPDYYSAWLWRVLIAGETKTRGVMTMLGINQVMPYEGDFIPSTRMYLVCTPKTSPHYKSGAVTAIWLNTDANSNKSILLYQGQRFGGRRLKDSPAVPPPFPNLPRVDYVLTPPRGDLLSREMLLNGELLVLRDGGVLPDVPTGHTATKENFVVPPSSYGFAIYPNANAPACIAAEGSAVMHDEVKFVIRVLR